jgi:hypothetical protein
MTEAAAGSAVGHGVEQGRGLANRAAKDHQALIGDERSGFFRGAEFTRVFFSQGVDMLGIVSSVEY